MKKNILKTLFISDLELMEVNGQSNTKQYVIRAHRKNDFISIVIESDVQQNLSLYMTFVNGYRERIEDQPQICKLLLEKVA
ncbi:hypothetical protein [Litchfieldia alkalitelluris]|uniref:hypothetical protein n=1 Tax=Litchfieldia alkalitelluris TaxID=304268 RepID=UPI0011175308|nr:hypothetical protein [Litchfieldia alkalitelluris]